MQVQSAISLLYVHWNPDKSHINCNSSSIRVGLARLPVLSPMGEPNTPLTFWQRDECHLNQQAGHRKIAVRIGQSTKNFISLVANYDICFMHIIPAEELVRTLQNVIWRYWYIQNKIIRRKMKVSHRHLNMISSIKTYRTIRQNIGQALALHIGYVIDIISPILKFGYPYLQPILIIIIKLAISNRNAKCLLIKIVLILMAEIYREISKSLVFF